MKNILRIIIKKEVIQRDNRGNILSPGNSVVHILCRYNDIVVELSLSCSIYFKMF